MSAAAYATLGIYGMEYVTIADMKNKKEQERKQEMDRLAKSDFKQIRLEDLYEKFIN